jgi:hypothetical protein
MRRGVLKLAGRRCSHWNDEFGRPNAQCGARPLCHSAANPDRKGVILRDQSYEYPFPIRPQPTWVGNVPVTDDRVDLCIICVAWKLSFSFLPVFWMAFHGFMFGVVSIVFYRYPFCFWWGGFERSFAVLFASLGRLLLVICLLTICAWFYCPRIY